MRRRGGLLAGVTALALLASGVVVASALNDLPQDARPAPDPTADLNRQQLPSPQPNPSAPPVPPEPAPEAEPAPARPIPITPPAPVVVIADQPAGAETAETEDEEEEPAAEAAPPAPAPDAPPARRQRARIAVVEAVDKITAEKMRFEVEVGGRPVRFQKALIFTARACEISAPDELVPDSVAYLEISIQPRGVLNSTEPRQIFRGWMFASAPAVNGLQHPVYDAWVVGCRA